MSKEPHTVEAVIARLRAYAKAQNWTKSRFAWEAGLRDTVLRDFWNESWRPRTETLLRLEAIVPEDFVPEQESAA